MEIKVGINRGAGGVVRVVLTGGIVRVVFKGWIWGAAEVGINIDGANWVWLQGYETDLFLGVVMFHVFLAGPFAHCSLKVCSVTFHIVAFSDWIS